MFVGRESELAALKGIWSKAKTGEPQLAVILAESGFGKTRLAQEFYNWLSVTDDPAGVPGYWPDTLAKRGRNLEVNPDPETCGLNDGDPPYIWWGMRISDPMGYGRNISAANAVGLGVHALRPHLATLEAAIEGTNRRENRNRVIAMEAGASLISSIPVFGTIVGLGIAGAKIGQAIYDDVSGRMEDQSTDRLPGAAGNRDMQDLTEQIIRILRVVAFNPPKGLAKRPIVILIDDAQWSDRDPSVTDFCSRLMRQASREGWPLMLLVTSWFHEWHTGSSALESDAIQPTANHLKTVMEDMNPDDAHVLQLGRVEGLGVTVRAKLPGVTDDQVRLFEERADGNPLFMEELIAEFQSKPRWFVDRDLAKQLTPEGEKRVLECEFAELVYERLREAPEHVRNSLVLASLQGIRFSRRLTLDVGFRLQQNDVNLGLSEADVPHAFVSHLAEDRHEFRTRLYQEAARKHLADLMDEGQALKALKQAKESLSVQQIGTASDADLEAILVDLETEGLTPRILAAAYVLVDRLQVRYEINAACQISKAVLEAKIPEGGVSINHQSFWWLMKFIDAIRTRSSEERELAKLWLKRIKHVQSKSLEDANSNAIRNYSITIERLMLIEKAEANFDSALSLCRECLDYKKLLLDKNPSPTSRRDLSVIQLSLAELENTCGDRRAMLPLLLDCLKIRQELQNEFNSVTARSDLADAHASLGLCYREASETARARFHYEAALEEMKLRWEEEGRPVSKILFLPHWQNLGSFELDQGKLTKAREYFLASAEEAEADWKRLNTPQSIYHLSIALCWLADLEKQDGNRDKARELYFEGMEYARFYWEQVGTASACYNYSIFLEKIGKLEMLVDNPDEARKYFLMNLENMKAVWEQTVETKLRRGLAIAFSNLSDLESSLKNRSLAREYSTQYLNHCQALWEETDSASVRFDLAHATANAGVAEFNAGNLTEARMTYEEARSHLEALWTQNGNVNARSVLADVVQRLSLVELRIGKRRKAYALLEECRAHRLALWEQLKTPQACRNLAVAYQQITHMHLRRLNFVAAWRNFACITELCGELFEILEPHGWKYGEVIRYLKQGG